LIHFSLLARRTEVWLSQAEPALRQNQRRMRTMSVTRSSLLFFLLLLTVVAFAQADQAPAFHGLASRAEVTGPRGSFVTEMISLADGTTRFVQIYPPNVPQGRGRVELVVAGGTVAFQRDAKGAFVPGDPGTSSFVLGHDAVRLALAAGSRATRVSRPGPAEMGGGTVTIELADYRRHIGLELPFSATFVHSAAPKDRYVYRYTELLPFRIAPGSPAPSGPTNAALLFERLGDFREIAAAHERVMAAHRASDAKLLTADAAGLSTVSGRGRLSEVKREEQLARMREYLGAIRFSRYEDTVVPVIALSEDGSLAWLACEMEAEGVRTAEGKSEPIAYAFSWVEHYARGSADAQGRRPWSAIGNASSLRP
jgi:hypothetical protein